MSARAFVAPDAPLLAGQTLQLDRDESHYVVRVRRLVAGDRLDLLDGEGRQAQSTIVQADPRALTVKIVSVVPIAVMAGPRIKVCVAIPDTAALAEVVEAATVMNASHLLLVRTQHAQRLVTTPERFDKQIRAAMRQSGRPDRLLIQGPIDLPQALAELAPGFFAWERHAADVAQPRPHLSTLLVGPEAGFTAQEAKLALASGWQALSLGRYILRTPLAVVAGLAWMAAPPKIADP